MPVGPVARDAATKEFFDGTSRGEFLLRHCTVCDAVSAPQAQQCQACNSTDLGWEPASGLAVPAAAPAAARTVTSQHPVPKPSVALDLGSALEAFMGGVGGGDSDGDSGSGGGGGGVSGLPAMQEPAAGPAAWSAAALATAHGTARPRTAHSSSYASLSDSYRGAAPARAGNGADMQQGGEMPASQPPVTAAAAAAAAAAGPGARPPALGRPVSFQVRPPEAGKKFLKLVRTASFLHPT